jgi:hypothetical protein
MVNARDQIAQIIEDEICLERFGGIVGMDAAADAILAALPSILGFPVVECDQAPKNKVTFMSGGSVIGAFDVDDPSLD